MLSKGCFSDEDIKNMELRVEAYRRQISFVEIMHSGVEMRSAINEEQEDSAMQNLGDSRDRIYNSLYCTL